MAGYTGFLFVYLLGGFTFLPLLIGLIFLHGYLTLPIHDETPAAGDAEALLREGDSSEAISSVASGLDKKFYARSSHDLDVAAGYFAVCREYVPGGVNGKPPERTTPTGSTTVSSPSPSVYQSMYRSIFDRNKSNGPLDKGAGKPQRKGGNVFYVVLRHSHLMLFDDDEMTEVRYVISLAHHEVSIYAGGESVPDGELFIKRNALCLSRKVDAGELTADGTASKPFYLFSENTSEKEDFYFAMLKNQERSSEAGYNPPMPLQFDVKHIINLVQRLHSSEEQLQTRWVNAIMGRVFLGLYKTSDVENFIRAKITKKISRVKTPSFLSQIKLRSVDMGEGPPYITNPRLKDLTVDGDCVVEADMKYTGNFRLEVAATLRVELGARFKAREVNLVLAVVVKKIEGHMQLRIKPPPSNRLWYTFVTMPKVEFSVEPIVSSRQITYTVILRQIENRIKEVIAESIVMPFWDDMVFFSTVGKKWRGGIWVDDKPGHLSQDPETQIAEDGDVNEIDRLETEPSSIDLPPIEKSMSVPVLDTPPATVYSRKAAKSVFNLGVSKAAASSTSVDTSKSLPIDKPRAMRQGSFTAASSPSITTDVVNADAIKSNTPPDQSHAAAAMAAISARSQPITPVGSPSRSSQQDKAGSVSSISSYTSEHSEHNASDVNPNVTDYDLHPAELTPQPTHSKSFENMHSFPPSPSGASNTFLQYGPSNVSNGERQRQDSASTTSSIRSDHLVDTNSSSKRVMLTSVANAAASAKRWGLNALAARNGDARKEGLPDSDHRPDTSLPMGRGRPLPPPGTPLPRPDRKTKTAPIPVPKRKPVAPPPVPPQPLATQGPVSTTRRSIAPPALPERPNRSHAASEYDDDGIFVVPAPETGSTTPPADDKQNYLPPWVDDVEDEDITPDLSLYEDLTTTGELRPIRKGDVTRKSKTPPKLPSRTNARSASPVHARRPEKSMSTSPEEDTRQLPSWMVAQEQEARARSMFVDDDAGNLHQ